MAYIVLTIAAVFVAYLIGYRMGYHDCYKFLMQKLKEHIDETTGRKYD